MRHQDLGTMNAILDAALTYAARGWNVFPCHSVIDGRCTCGERDCDKPGKHPRTAHGFKDATTDASVIRAWWERWPEANVAIATGQCSGLAVLDVDDYAGGDDELRELERVHGALPDAPVSLTGGGGRQFLFERNGVPIVSRNGVVAPHIDVKADGGYIIAPPSSHLSGRRYAWDGAAHPDDVPLSPAPKFMESPPAPTAAAPATSGRIEPPRGTARHAALWNYANRWVTLGLGAAEVRTMAFHLADEWGVLAEGRANEVENIVTGALLKARVTEAIRELPHPAELYGPAFTPRRPEFDVAGLIRRKGLVLAWAAPGGLKTHAALTLCHEMLIHTDRGLFDQGRGNYLFGHPDLWINRRWNRTLWIATEECGDELRAQAEEIRNGLGRSALDGELRYLFASEAGGRITLDDLPELIERDGPWDAIVLDSLTGLRPKVVNGQTVRWDLDNDASNEQCLALRGLAAKHSVCFLILHHTGRDTTRYRGGVEWWASADTMFGFLPDNGRVKVDVEKVRGARKPGAFLLDPEWGAETFTLRYAAAATDAQLTPAAKTVLTWLQGRQQASQADVLTAKLGARSTVQRSIKALLSAGEIRDTGLKVNGSPVYAVVPEGARSDVGTPEDET
jgi:hypothetical protein